ncbi:MAG TPA: hypothetical protein ENN81_09195, partial [Phycisphaerales bacterium]|nr:hypothetical protein [Phycisphaerales bacterium]
MDESRWCRRYDDEMFRFAQQGRLPDDRSPMRILMLNYEFPPIGGGAGMAHKALLGKYARSADLHVDVLTSGRRPGLTTER